MAEMSSTIARLSDQYYEVTAELKAERTRTAIKQVTQLQHVDICATEVTRPQCGCSVTVNIVTVNPN
jgi:hypothetical protein